MTLSWGGKVSPFLGGHSPGTTAPGSREQASMAACLGPAFSGSPPSLSCPPGLRAAAARGGRDRAQLPRSAVRHAVAVLPHLPHLRAR